jgi:3,4-dihydroxy 2-butanone 4-phosphate synthase/GTP cyclohydrolase II
MSSDEANLFFGHKIDEREYSMVTKVLQVLNIRDVKLMTGNLDKVKAVKNAGVRIHGLSDINRDHILPNTRKYNELIEKSKRNYNYNLSREEA